MSEQGAGAMRPEEALKAHYIPVPKHLFSRLLYTNPVCFLVSKNNTHTKAVEGEEGEGANNNDDNNNYNVMTVSWVTAIDNQGHFVMSLNEGRHTVRNFLLLGGGGGERRSQEQQGILQQSSSSASTPAYFTLSPATAGMESMLLAVGSESGTTTKDDDDDDRKMKKKDTDNNNMGDNMKTRQNKGNNSERSCNDEMEDTAEMVQIGNNNKPLGKAVKLGIPLVNPGGGEGGGKRRREEDRLPLSSSSNSSTTTTISTTVTDTSITEALPSMLKESPQVSPYPRNHQSSVTESISTNTPPVTASTPPPDMFPPQLCEKTTSRETKNNKSSNSSRNRNTGVTPASRTILSPTTSYAGSVQAVDGCPAHLVCVVESILSPSVDTTTTTPSSSSSLYGHCIFLCKIVDAFVNPLYWSTGKTFGADHSTNLPGLLSFMGSKQFAEMVPHSSQVSGEGRG